MFRLYDIVVVFYQLIALNNYYVDNLYLSPDISSRTFIVYDLSGSPGQGYYMTVYVGRPGQKMQLLVDTGSSNLALAGRYLKNVDHWFQSNKSSTLKCNSHFNQHVHYLKGYWSGIYCQDEFDFTKKQGSMIINHHYSMINDNKLDMIFSLINKSKKVFLSHTTTHLTWNGIIGLGFASIYVKPRSMKRKYDDYQNNNVLMDRVKQSMNKIVSDDQLTYLDQLNSQWEIHKRFGLLLCGTTLYTNRNMNSLQMSGRLIIGQTDINLFWPFDNVSLLKMSKFKPSTIYFTPIRKAWYYEIILTNLLIDKYSLVDNCKELNLYRTIIDSGTTNIFLPVKIFQRLTRIILRKFLTKNTLFKDILFKQLFWTGKKAYCLPNMNNNNNKTRKNEELIGLFYKSFPSLEFQLVSSINTTSHVLSLMFSPQQYIRYLGRINQKNQNWFH
ncbi:unnamed protein product [Schistosoma turkestanicum]|nr:unnamed protein product [Schistosoma turkestanicum]